MHRYHLTAPASLNRPQDSILPALPPAMRSAAKVEEGGAPDADFTLVIDGPALAPHVLAGWLDSYCAPMITLLWRGHADESWAVWMS